MTRQYHLPLPQHEAMSAEDFMITSSNREAAAWIIERAPSSWPSYCLILYGTNGCGKTHLLNIWKEANEAKIIKLGEDIVSDIMNNPTNFPSIAIDNIDKISGNSEYQEWLQHIYNATKSAGIYLLLTAQTPPSNWDLGLKDIKSRLKSCASIEIKEPDDALMRGMLLKQFGDRQLLVEASVIEYLAGRLERTGLAIRQIVDILDKKALEQGSKITIPFVQQELVSDQSCHI